MSAPRAGDNLGETPRPVVGDPFTPEQADAFAAALEISPEDDQ